MTAADYAKLRRRVGAVSGRMGIRQDADDCTHEILLQKLQGKALKQSVFHGVVDAIKKAQRGMEHGNRERFSTYLDHLPAPIKDWDAIGEIETRLADIHKIYRAMLMLKYHWGMSNAEIAHCFGVTELAVAQRIHWALKELRK